MKNIGKRIGILTGFLYLIQFVNSQTSETTQANDICSICYCDSGLKPFLINCQEQRQKILFTENDWRKTLEKYETNITLDVRFDDNQFEEIPKFPNLPIVSLSFRNNKINRIEDSAFENLEQLASLDLSQNLLSAKDLPEAVFYGHFNASSYYSPLPIQHLNLSSNNLLSIEKDLLDHFPVLTSLDLSHNPLKILGSTGIAIAELKSLEYLSLRDTKLSKIPDAMLHELSNLKSLDLSDNQFTTVPKELSNTHGLITLSLDGNKFEYFDQDSFVGLKTLKELYISDMRTLKLIERDTFGPLKKLEKLYCSYNKNLDRIHNAAFEGITNSSDAGDWPLMELYLNDNALTHVSDGLVPWKVVRYIDVQNNPFKCDCELEWMATELMPELIRTNPELTTNIRCNCPPEMKGDSIVELGMEPESFAKCSSSRRYLRGRGYGVENKYKYHQAAATTVLVIGIILIVIGLSIFGVLIVKRRAIAAALINHQQIRYQRAEEDDDEQDIYKSAASSKFDSI